jgi:hypothetical protein
LVLRLRPHGSLWVNVTPAIRVLHHCRVALEEAHVLLLRGLLGPGLRHGHRGLLLLLGHLRHSLLRLREVLLNVLVGRH